MEETAERESTQVREAFICEWLICCSTMPLSSVVFWVVGAGPWSRKVCKLPEAVKIPNSGCRSCGSRWPKMNLTRDWAQTFKRLLHSVSIHFWYNNECKLEEFCSH